MNSMDTTLSVLLILSFLVLKTAAIRGSKYEFIFENDKVFEKCSEIPGNNGVHDIMDMSNFIIEYNDGGIHIGGNMTIEWDIQPTDRVELHAELFKLQRGSWQPTVFSLKVTDFCKDQFKAGTIWNNSWSKYILPEDQICINNYKHVYHYESIDLDNNVNIGLNFEGVHKARVFFHAFDDKLRIRRPNSVCFELVGDLVKIRK